MHDFSYCNQIFEIFFVVYLFGLNAREDHFLYGYSNDYPHDVYINKIINEEIVYEFL